MFTSPLRKIRLTALTLLLSSAALAAPAEDPLIRAFNEGTRPSVSPSRPLDDEYRHAPKNDRLRRAAIAYAAAFTSKTPEVWLRRLAENSRNDSQFRVAENLGRAYATLLDATGDRIWARALIQGTGAHFDGAPGETFDGARIAAMIAHPAMFAAAARRAPFRGETHGAWGPSIVWGLRNDTDRGKQLRASLRRASPAVRADYARLLRMLGPESPKREPAAFRPAPSGPRGDKDGHFQTPGRQGHTFYEPRRAIALPLADLGSRVGDGAEADFRAGSQRR